MLVNSTIANEFLTSYKAVLAEVHDGKNPQDTAEFVECRKSLYSDSVSIAELTSIVENFKNTLRKSIYGQGELKGVN